MVGPDPSISVVQAKRGRQSEHYLTPGPISGTIRDLFYFLLTSQSQADEEFCGVAGGQEDGVTAG